MRTANAGGLLKIDGVSILLDGVSNAAGDYLATPQNVRSFLCRQPLDVIAFTHNHSDHFTADFVRQYARNHKLPRLIGPKDIAADLPDFPVMTSSVQAKPVLVIAVPSRHIGTEYRNTPHYSFIIKGSSQIWFTGDASPLQWQDQERLPHPDLLIAPFAYAATEASWKITEQLAPDWLILLHMPGREQDAAQLWPAVERVLDRHPCQVVIPEMGEECTF